MLGLAAVQDKHHVMQVNQMSSKREIERVGDPSLPMKAGDHTCLYCGICEPIVKNFSEFQVLGVNDAHVTDLLRKHATAHRHLVAWQATAKRHGAREKTKPRSWDVTYLGDACVCALVDQKVVGRASVDLRYTRFMVLEPDTTVSGLLTGDRIKLCISPNL